MKLMTRLLRTTLRALTKILQGLCVVLAACGGSTYALAHGDEIEAGKGGAGPVALSAAQQRSIGLQTEPTSLRPLTKVLTLNGEVRLVPGRQADVSPRINGQVIALYANLGEVVRKGQRLVRVQSRLVGDPPPSVTINAPMSGTVDALNVAPGQSVDPSTVLYRISDRTQVNVVARLFEEDVSKVKLGQRVSVSVLGYPDRQFMGRVILVGPSLDAQSRTLEVWVRLANPEALLKPNLFAQARIVLQQNASALTIPRAALIEANREKFVFVRIGAQFRRVEVTTGLSDDRYIEVTQGLKLTDVVVTQGNRQVYTFWLTGGKPLKSGDDD